MIEHYDDMMCCPHCGEEIEFQVSVEGEAYIGAELMTECTICEKSKSEHHIYQGY